MIVYLDEVRRFVLILPKWVDILKLLALKMVAKIGRFWNIKLNALSVDDDIYIYIYIYKQNNNICDKVYSNRCGLNLPEDGVECESFTTSSIDCLLVSDKKIYLYVYLHNCA